MSDQFPTHSTSRPIARRADPDLVAPDPANQPYRYAALEWLDGMSRGWQARDVTDWIERSVCGPGLLISRSEPGSLLVREARLSALRVTWPPTGMGEELELALTEIANHARNRVCQTLKGLLGFPQDDRFIQTAIYAGQVERVRGPQGVAWQPRLAEGEPLSQWVLAMFAADALKSRNDYDSQLSVCDVCNQVSFRKASLRRRCIAHVDHGRPSANKIRATRMAVGSRIRKAKDFEDLAKAYPLCLVIPSKRWWMQPTIVNRFANHWHTAAKDPMAKDPRKNPNPQGRR